MSSSASLGGKALVGTGHSSSRLPNDDLISPVWIFKLYSAVLRVPVYILSSPLKENGDSMTNVLILVGNLLRPYMGVK